MMLSSMVRSAAVIARAAQPVLRGVLPTAARAVPRVSSLHLSTSAGGAGRGGRAALGGAVAATGVAATVAWLEHQAAVAGCEEAEVADEIMWDFDWDHRHEGWMEYMTPDAVEDGETPKKKKKKKKRGARYIVMVRHGQYVHDSERHLTELGKEQAEVTGKRLVDLGIKFDKIWYSDVTRATETSRIIEKHLPEVPTEMSQLLRESAPCPPDPPHPTWKPSKADFFAEGARVEAGFREFFHRADPDQFEPTYELLVCHGNVIRYCTLRALQLTPEAWLRLSHANCGITTLRVSGYDGSVSLDGFGDTHILTKDQITFN